MTNYLEGLTMIFGKEETEPTDENRMTLKSFLVLAAVSCILLVITILGIL